MSYDQDRGRADFLIAMYNQLTNEISRHIVIVWQSIGTLFAAIASFALVEKGFVPLDGGITFIILICSWLLAHIFDASLWYNRNLVIIANIERQFLKYSDLKEIHCYFGKHRKSASMLKHLKIQLYLAIGISMLSFLYYLSNDILPCLLEKEVFKCISVLPVLSFIVFVYVWHKMYFSAKDRYEDFLRNSPGKDIDASKISYGSSHPVDD